MDSTQQIEQLEEKKIELERVEGHGDLLLATIIIVLAIGVIIMSLRMPRPGGWASSPGIFPLFASIILLGLGIGLFFSTINKKKLRLSISFSLKKIDGESRTFAKRTVVAVMGILIYICVLIPTVHFTIATFVYLVGTLWYFWGGKGYKIFIISISATLFLSEVFKRIFQIILP